MVDLSSLYPQPPQNQPTSLLANPQTAINALSGLTILQRQQMELQGQRAFGQIYAQHVTPDGVDTQGILRDAANNPAAALVLPEYTGSVLQQRQQQLNNAQTWLGLNGAQSKATLDFLTSLDPEKSTPEDVRNAAATWSRLMPAIPGGTSGPIISGVMNSILQNPKGIGAGIIAMRNIARGPEAISAPSSAVGYTGAGAPIPGTQQQFLERYGPGGASGPQGGGVSLTPPPPGFAERAAGAATIDTQLATNLANAAEGSPGRLAILGNLQDVMHNFTTGPGADWTKVAKAFVNRNVPLPKGWQFDPQSIASQEEFNKQAYQLAQQQFGLIGGTGTDAKFNSAFETNPNDTLSQLGNEGIIRLLKGNEDALQSKNRAWLQATASNPNLPYRQFSQEFNNHFDPRVFQFKYLSPAGRSEYYGQMSPQDQQKFLYDLTFARKQGWIDYATPSR